MPREERYKKDIDYNSIVFIRKDILLLEGNREFIKRYNKYGYGFLYLDEDAYCRDAVNVVIPNTTSIRQSDFRHYVNVFRSDYCKIIKTDELHSLRNVPLKKRLDSFCSNCTN